MEDNSDIPIQQNKWMWRMYQINGTEMEWNNQWEDIPEMEERKVFDTAGFSLATIGTAKP